MVTRAVRTVTGLMLVAAVVVLALWSLALVRDGFLEGVMALSVAGGTVIAWLMSHARSGGSRVSISPDPFAATAYSTDTLNFAHIRVAGLGGAGLVAAALVVALQYPLTTAVTVLGIVGGALIGVALILARQRRTIS